MKKTLIALATLAAVSGTAFAQSSVTLSGKVGFGVTGSTFKDGTSTNVLGSTDNAVTFAVTEDLGGGMKVAASQTLAFGGAQGGNAINDGGTVAISGGFGEAKFGMACASGALGEAIVGGGAYHWAHAVSASGVDCREYKYGLYTLPTLVNGLTMAVRVQNMTATSALSLDDFSAAGNGVQARFNYATGALTTGFYVRSNTSEVHAAYDFGMAKVSFGADTQVASGDKRTEVGVSAPFGDLTLKAGFGKKGAIKGTEVGAFYALSKRTTLAAIVGDFTANAAQADGVEQTKTTRVSLTHAF